MMILIFIKSAINQSTVWEPYTSPKTYKARMEPPLGPEVSHIPPHSSIEAVKKAREGEIEIYNQQCRSRANDAAIRRRYLEHEGNLRS
jgi:hypothetical protein